MKGMGYLKGGEIRSKAERQPITESYNYYIETDLSKYVGEWIAIVDKTIVSHDKSAKKAYKEATEKYPKMRPLLAKVPTEKALIF